MSIDFNNENYNPSLVKKIKIKMRSYVLVQSYFFNL